MTALLQSSSTNNQGIQPPEPNQQENQCKCYIDNANEIAPYFIDASLFSSKKHDDNSLFHSQVSQALYEILPSSYWKIIDSIDSTASITSNFSSTSEGDDFTETSSVPSYIQDQVHIKILTGGLSNHLFTVTNKETNKMVLLRIHPTSDDDEDDLSTTDNETSLINREFENHIIAYLSKHNIGPKFYGRFQNGRIEEFYINHKPLSYKDMCLSKYARGIAKEMSNLHSLPLDQLMTLSKSYSKKNDDDTNGNCNDDDDDYDVVKEIGDVWQRIDKWINLANETLVQSSSISNKNLTSNDLAVLHSLLQTIENEWKWYKGQMKMNQINNDSVSSSSSSLEVIAMEFCREVVFTHMDCQSLNILTPEEVVVSKTKADVVNVQPSSGSGSGNSTMDGIILRSNDFSSSPLSDVSISPSPSSSPLSSSLILNATDKDEDCATITPSSGNIKLIDNATVNTMNSTQASSSSSEQDLAVVRLIDFEYAGYNRRVVDIANTFLEHCDMNNLKPNYVLEYPSEEEQNVYIEEYVNQCWNNNYVKSKKGQMHSGENNENEEKSSVLVDKLVTYMPDVTSSTSTDKDGKRRRTSEWKLILEVIRKEIMKHTLISHLKWAAWSIIQVNNDIDFDYIKYATLRMDGYFYFKNQSFVEKEDGTR